MRDVSEWWFGWEEGVTGPRVANSERESKCCDTAVDEATKAAVVAWFNHAIGETQEEDGE